MSDRQPPLSVLPDLDAPYIAAFSVHHQRSVILEVSVRAEDEETAAAVCSAAAQEFAAQAPEPLSFWDRFLAEFRQAIRLAMQMSQGGAQGPVRGVYTNPNPRKQEPSPLVEDDEETTEEPTE